jgi:hypothetical protein
VKKSQLFFALRRYVKLLLMQDSTLNAVLSERHHRRLRLAERDAAMRGDEAFNLGQKLNRNDCQHLTHDILVRIIESAYFGVPTAPTTVVEYVMFCDAPERNTWLSVAKLPMRVDSETDELVTLSVESPSFQPIVAVTVPAEPAG